MTLFKTLIPKVFYADLNVGRDLFVDGLGMAVVHDDGDFVVLERDGCKLYLVQDAEYAAKDRPELGIETDAIDAIHADIAARRPDLLHPTYPAGGGIVRREYGAREFAVLDSTTVCVVFRDWS
ncbi:MAG TPA: hypothetical protein VM429_04190 [Micropruina sp.]|nr:hypothetical protein [Micropruina sp.]